MSAAHGWRTHDSVSTSPPSRPPVSPADMQSDWVWFGANPTRRYRVRRAPSGWWIVRRRRGSLYLRVWSTSLPRIPETVGDEGIRPYWFLAAYPDLDPKTRGKLISKARANERGHIARAKTPTGAGAYRNGPGLLSQEHDDQGENS